MVTTGGKRFWMQQQQQQQQQSQPTHHTTYSLHTIQLFLNGLWFFIIYICHCHFLWFWNVWVESYTLSKYWWQKAARGQRSSRVLSRHLYKASVHFLFYLYLLDPRMESIFFVVAISNVQRSICGFFCLYSLLVFDPSNINRNVGFYLRAW